MSTPNTPLAGQPDPSQTGSQPKQGFWGILKNRVLPQVGNAADRLAMSFGTPQQANAARTGMENDLQQKEFARQQQFDIPALAEASVHAQVAQGTAPDQIMAYHSAAVEAARKAAMTPGTLADLQKQEEVKATAPITGLMNLASQNQPGPAQTSPATTGTSADTAGAPGTPATPPSPIAQASSSIGGMPAPQEILAAQLAKMTGKPVADKEPTRNSDGTWSIKERNPYTLQQVGEQPANAPMSQIPNKTLIPYLPTGVNPNNAKQEDWATAANVYNTRESSRTGIQMVPQPDGTIAPVTVTSSSSMSRGTAPSTPSTPSSPTSPQTPVKPQLKPRASASGGGGKVPPGVSKAYGDYNGALTRQEVMTKSLPEALAGNQQAMINILANHLGMTAGIQKGARINQAMWNEAMTSTPWIQSVVARFGHTDQSTGDFVFDGPLSGVTIPPEALKQMVSLAGDRVDAQKAQWQREIAAAKTGYGMASSPAGGGGGKAAPSAGPKWNPKTARFE